MMESQDRLAKIKAEHRQQVVQARKLMEQEVKRVKETISTLEAQARFNQELKSEADLIVKSLEISDQYAPRSLGSEEDGAREIASAANKELERLQKRLIHEQERLQRLGEGVQTLDEFIDGPPEPPDLSTYFGVGVARRRRD